MKIKPIHISIALLIFFGVLNLTGITYLVSMLVNPEHSYGSSRSSSKREKSERKERNREGSVTRAKVQLLGEAVQRHKSVFGHPPKQKSVIHLCRYLIKIGYFENTYEMRNFGKDEWGELISYYDGGSYSHDYYVVSYGPNGRYDQRQGDDISWENGKFTN